MAKVVWSPDSLDDIERIADYIAQDSPERAALFVSRLIDAVDRLIDYPHSGRMTPEIGRENHRQIICGAYRITYSIVGDAVRIMRVIHGARDWRPQ